MSSSGAAVGFPGAKADSTGVTAGSALVGVGDGSRDGIVIAVAPGIEDDSCDEIAAAVGVGVDNGSCDGTTVDVVVGALAQAFKTSSKDKIKEGTNRNLLMNTSAGKSGYSAEFELNIALTP